jgi:hypothetical protein
MNPVPDQNSEHTLDIVEVGSANYSILDEYQGISTSHHPFDPSTYFSNIPLDDDFFQGLKGHEPYFYDLRNRLSSTPLSSPSAYLTLAASLPSGKNGEFPFPARTDPQVPRPMDTMSSPSTNPFNESFPFPSQVSADTSFGPGKELDSGAATPIQSVRNNQLEKVSDSLFPYFHRFLTDSSDGLKTGTLNVLSGSGRSPIRIAWSESSYVFGRSTTQR